MPANPEIEPVQPPDIEYGGELREKCGVTAVHDPDGRAPQAALFALEALQHRGQDGAGISHFEANNEGGFRLRLKKELGRVAAGFSKNDYEAVKSETAAGQVRYGTTEAENEYDALQPIPFKVAGKVFTLSHNGQFDMGTLDMLAKEYRTGWTGTDSERVVDLLKEQAVLSGEDLESAISCLMPRLEGAFSLTIAGEDSIYGIRDRHGLRPLVVGKKGKATMIASEICGLKAPDKEGRPQLGFEFDHVVAPGTYVKVDKDGEQTVRWAEKDEKPCIFEDIYLSKPDNIVDVEGGPVRAYRVDAGRILGSREDHKSEMVIPVLGSAKTYAEGYAEASNIPYVEALKKNPDRKNPQSDRTFIETTQAAREAAVTDKFVVDAEAVAGKEVTLIDDSLVRGTTMNVIIKLLKDAGASKVHVRIGSPRYVRPCAFGINVQSEEELLAYRRSVSEMAELIGADSLTFLSRSEMYAAKGVTSDKVCSGCMGGQYPSKSSDKESAIQPKIAAQPTSL